MSDMVHLLWFAKEMPEGEEDVELLIGVYSSEEEARATIELGIPPVSTCSAQLA